MLFAVIVIGVSSDHADPKTLLEAAHKEPAVDRRRLPFVVQAVVKISGDVLESATKVCRKILWALAVLVQGSCVRLKAVMNFSRWGIVVLDEYYLDSENWLHNG